MSDNTYIYTDGAVSKRDCTFVGSNGFIVVKNKEIIYEYSQFNNDTTINREELKAIIASVKFINSKKIKNAIIKSDSSYCIDGINKNLKAWIKRNWKLYSGKEVKNLDIWKEFKKILGKCTDEIRFVHVSAHLKNTGEKDDTYFNNYIDRLVVKKKNENL